jgi:hypothetical protein
MAAAPGRLRPHQDEAGLRQVADQVLSGDAGHDFISIVGAPVAVVPEGVGEGIGNFSQFGPLPLQRCDSIPHAPPPGRPDSVS